YYPHKLYHCLHHYSLRFPMFFSLILPRPPRPTLFPYTTLFRSEEDAAQATWSKTARLISSTRSASSMARIIGRSRASPWTIFSTDRKSTRLNSSHVANSYAGFCLKKKSIGQERLVERLLNSRQ